MTAPATAQEVARFVRQLGGEALPLRAGEKAPIPAGWQRVQYEEHAIETLFAGNGPGGVGFRLDPPIVCVDLDTRETQQLGQQWLPPTGLVGGRSRAPRSHLFYRCTEAAFTVFADPAPKDDQRACLVEILTGSGHQVAVFGRHPSGDQYRFESTGAPATVPWPVLYEAAARTAAGALLIRHFPEPGKRQTYCLTLAGVLARAGWDEARIRAFLLPLLPLAGDDAAEFQRRCEAISYTCAKTAAGERITGIPSLKKLLPAPVVDAFVSWLSAAAMPEEDELVLSGLTSEDAAATLERLAAWNEPSPRLFSRHAQLIEIGILYEHVDGRTLRKKRLKALDVQGFHNFLKEQLVFKKAIRTRDGFQRLVPADPPVSLAQYLVEREAAWPFPAISGITETPLLRPDLSLSMTPGYDEATGFWYEPSGAAIVVPRTVEEAVQVLRDLLSEFPFADSASEANTIASWLSHLLRPLGLRIPLCAISAPKAGTGKTRLVQLGCLICTGQETGATPFSRDEEELRKKLTSFVLSGRGVLFFDNVTVALESGPLEEFLTAERWSDRLLGNNKEIELKHTTMTFVTGNNLTIGRDLVRRSYLIRLDANVAIPWARTFRRREPIMEYAATHRGLLLGCLLRLIMHWKSQGKPPGSQCMENFELWSRMTGGILECAGIEGFLGTMQELWHRADPLEQQWDLFFEAWYEQFGPQAVTTGQVLDRFLDGTVPRPDASRPISLRELLPDSIVEGGKDLGRSLGRALRQREGFVSWSGYRLDSAGTRQRAVLWRVQQLLASHETQA